MTGLGMRESTARAWMNLDAAVTRLGRSQTADRPMHPICYRAERIMIEGCHFAGVDRSIGLHGIPAFPNRSCSHCDRIQPRWIFLLQQEAICRHIMPCAAQCIADQRCTHKARADVITTFTHEFVEAFTGMFALFGSGEQIKKLLEQQWSTQPKPRILQVSQGFRYMWDASRPVGDRVPAQSLTLHGQPLDPRGQYRVTVNAFLAAGGDGFSVLTEGQERRVGMVDVDALARYIQAMNPLSPGPLDRIQRVP